MRRRKSVDSGSSEVRLGVFRIVGAGLGWARPMSIATLWPASKHFTGRGKTYSSALSLGVDELLAELIVVLSGALAGALDDNLLEVVRQLVDDVPELTGHQLVEGPAALGVDLNSVEGRKQSMLAG